MGSKPILKISDLQVKRSQSFELLLSNLELKSGSVTCLVGANGSGKTTLLETIVGLIKPNKGIISLNGTQLRQKDWRSKRALGYVPDDDNWIIHELTALEYINLAAATFRDAGVRHDIVKTAMQLAKTLHFTSFDQQLGTLSHGNKKKVQIITALAHKPRLIIVDELRNGLDPIAISSAENLLKEQLTRGASILAATHDLWWAERIADTIVMIQDGNVVLHDSTANIVTMAGSVEAKFMELYST